MASAPSDLDVWVEKPLGELLVVQNGHAFSSKKFSTTEGIPLIRIRDLNPGTGTKTNFQGEFDPQFLVNRGDLLIGMDGEFRCNIWNGPEALLNQRVCRLQNFSEKLFPKFLFYGINKYLKEIEDVTGFTTVKHLSSKSIKAITFPIPPLSEQERIVGILDEAFEGIAAATAQAEKNLHNARELFQSVLQSTFSQKGDDWVETTLEKACTFKGGGTPSKKEPNYWNGKIPWVSPKDMKVKHVSNSMDKITDVALNNSSASLLPEGAILIVVRSGILARTIPLGIAACSLTVNQDLKALCPKDNLATEFLYYFLKANEPHLLSLVSRGATVHRIQSEFLKNLTIPVPPLSTQQSIVKKLDALSEETKRLEAIYERKQAALSELNQSLLQKAFAGEL